MITTERFKSKDTILCNNTYMISYFFHADVGKASFRFHYLESETCVPIRFQYADVKTPRHAFKVASAFLRGWTRQHLQDGWTGVLDLPAPH
jgi:hypothetical protein